MLIKISIQSKVGLTFIFSFNKFLITLSEKVFLNWNQTQNFESIVLIFGQLLQLFLCSYKRREYVSLIHHNYNQLVGNYYKLWGQLWLNFVDTYVRLLSHFVDSSHRFLCINEWTTNEKRITSQNNIVLSLCPVLSSTLL